MPLRTQGLDRTVSGRLSQRLLTAVSLTGIGSIVTLLVSSLAGLLIARNRGPSGYGVFVAVNLLVFVTSVFCSFGVPLALAKHAADEEERNNHEDIRRRNSTVFLLLLTFTLCISVGVAYNLPRFEQLLHVTVGRGFFYALPFVLMCAVISDCAYGIYTGLLHLKPVLLITLSGPVGVIAYSASLRTGAPLPVWGAVAILYCVPGIVSLVCLWRDRLLGRPAKLTTLAPILKDVFPAAAFTLFSVFSVSIDRLVVGSQLGAAAVGSYAAAMLVVQAALRIPKNVAYLLVPASSRIALGGDKKWLSFNEKTVKLFGLFAGIMTVILMLAPSVILHLLFGPGFASAGSVLFIFAPGLIAAAISVPFTSILTGSAHNRFVTYLLAGTCIPRVVLLWVFTRRWGLEGTAVATLIADILLAALCVAVAKKLTMNFPFRALQQPLAMAVIAYSVGWIAVVLGSHELPAAALGAAVYAAAAWNFVTRLIEGESHSEPGMANV